MDLVGGFADLAALEEVLLRRLVAGGRDQRGQHVFVRTDVVDDRPRLDHARPFDDGRDAISAFPIRVLLAAEHGGSTVGPGKGLGAVIRRVHDDGIVIEPERLELGEDLPDVPIMLDHAVRIDAEPRLAVRLLLQVREDVHAGGVPPHEEGLLILRGAVHEVQGFDRDFLVDRLHALARQRTRVRDAAVGEAMNDAARTKPLLELGIFRIVRVFGLFLGVEVIQVAEELVEAVIGRQHLVAVAQVVLAKLAGDVPLSL